MIYLILCLCFCSSALGILHDANRIFTYNVTPTLLTQKLLSYPHDNHLDFVGKAQEQGFVALEHKITTKDGYILKLFQIQSPLCYNYKHNPVLLIHGILMNSDSFLIAGPDAGLAYLMARDCFIVFVGNHRGTNYGREHLTLNPDSDAKFWNYTLSELGTDVKGMIDGAYRMFNRTKVDIITFGTGGAAFIAGMSSDTIYNTKVNRVVLLAPAKNFSYMRSYSLKFMMRTIANLEETLNSFGIYEILFKGSFFQSFLTLMCKSVSITRTLCRLPLKIADSLHEGAINDETLKSLYSVLLMGVSTKLMAHFEQMRQSDGFREFDHGMRINKIKYRQNTPPKYDLHSVLVPITIIAGPADKIVTVDEVKRFARQMRHAKLIVLPNPYWNHLDFIINPNVQSNSYPFIRSALLQI